jgi:hypothetical protein
VVVEKASKVIAMSAIRAVVDDYIARVRPEMEREFRYFQVLRTDEDAVSRAALAQLPNGKRHWHQRRIPRSALEKSRDRLLANLPALRAAASFDELFDLVNTLIRPIPKIGELAVYDTALRIGARFGLEPLTVYVHAGTRDGARALGLDVRCHVIEMHELPEPIRRLSGREAEDLLCRYKSKLARS